MSEAFVDDSGSVKSLKGKITEVQFEPEPTPREFLYGPIKPNLRRNLGVQESQVPTSQLDDEFTEEGIKLKAAKADADALQKFYIDLGHQENKKPGTLELFMKLLPSAQQINAAKALRKGDISKAYQHLQQEMVRQEQVQRRKAAKVKSEIQTRRVIEKGRKEKKEEDDKKKGKKKAKQRVNEKGQKVVANE